MVLYPKMVQFFIDRFLMHKQGFVTFNFTYEVVCDKKMYTFNVQ